MESRVAIGSRPSEFLKKCSSIRSTILRYVNNLSLDAGSL